VRQAADISDPRTLFVSRAGLEQAKALLARYKDGQVREMSEEVWRAKKVVDSTIHPGIFSFSRFFFSIR
jgi:hypothetical protein